MNDYDFQQELNYIQGHDPWEHSIGGGYDLENRRWNQLVTSRSRFGPAPTSGLYLPFQLMLMFVCAAALVLLVLM